MVGMRELSRQDRITARSLPELVEAIENAISAYGRSKAVRFRGRKLSREGFVNAAILALLELPAADQERALARAVARLEAILASDQPAVIGLVPGNPGPAPNDIPEYPKVDVELETPAPPSRRPRKRGNSG
jgi:hypothetical protein